MASYKQHSDSERVITEIISSSKFPHFKGKPFKEIKLEDTSSLGIDKPIVTISQSVVEVLRDPVGAHQPLLSDEEIAFQFLFAKVYDNRNNISQLYVSSSGNNGVNGGSF